MINIRKTYQYSASGTEYLLFYVIFAETQKFEEFDTGFILKVYLQRKKTG